MKTKIFLTILSLSVIALPAYAAPSISGVSSNFVHGNSVAITGSGFGNKSAAAPVVWDDCSGDDPLDLWTNVYNDMSSSIYITDYRTPVELGRNVELPHNHVSKYLCGAHAPGETARDGYNVGFFKNRILSGLPAYSFISFYTRIDPLWDWTTHFQSGTHTGSNDSSIMVDTNTDWLTNKYTGVIIYNTTDGSSGTIIDNTSNTVTATLFGGADNNWDYGDEYYFIPNDDNFKEYCWSAGNTPYNGSIGFFYQESYLRTGWHMVGNCITNGHGVPGAPVHFTETTGWVKIEMAIKFTASPDTSGFIKIWQNGVPTINYSGTTDPGFGTTVNRTETIGGYVRDNSSHRLAADNWRYWNDIYYDYSLQRVMICDASSLENCTAFREVQIPTAWSDSSIAVTVNEGAAPNGTAYLYVFDETGNANSVGYPIMIGAGGDTTAPASPSGLSVS